MKKTTLLLLVLVSIITVTGCKKDKFSDKSTQEKILGKWNYISQITETAEPPNPTKVITRPGKAGDYIDFRSDRTMYYVINGGVEKQDHYSLTNDTEIIIDGGPYTITELTESRFVMRNISQEGGRTYTIIITLSK
jgi:hypothetical protein